MIFLKIDGITKATGITGTHLGSAGWMEITSIQWGTARGVKNSGGNRIGDSVSFSEVTVTKALDAASANLFKSSTTGEGKKATIHVTATQTGGEEKEFMEYILSDAILTGFYHASNGDRPMETISLSFTEVKFNQLELDKDSSGKGPNRVGYNVATKTGS